MITGSSYPGIAQGSGVYNRGDAAYGRIVADTNGYTYVNYGVNGLNGDNLVVEADGTYTVVLDMTDESLTLQPA